MTKLSVIPLRIPDRWSPKWFDRFVRETLATQGTILKGNGVPAASLGVNGNCYVDEQGGAGTTFYVKEAGTWVAK